MAGLKSEKGMGIDKKNQEKNLLTEARNGGGGSGKEEWSLASMPRKSLGKLKTKQSLWFPDWGFHDLQKSSYKKEEQREVEQD